MKRFVLFIAAFALVISVGLSTGCAQLGAVNGKIVQDVENIIAPIKQATLEDAQAALAIANANGDTDAAPCYQDIVDELSKPGNTGLPAINGLLSAMEAARTFKAPSVPPKLHKDCAVLVVDAQQTAFKLGLTAGSAALGVSNVAGAVKLKAGAAALAKEAAALGAHP